MNALKTKLLDSLYIAWTIASRDIVDALRHKKTRVNIMLMFGLVVFFYYFSTVRSFDKRIDVVFYDQGDTSLSLESSKLEDGYSFTFQEASSWQEMQDRMGWKELGLVIPADFDQALESGGELVLQGYIAWVHRAQAAKLESKYSAKLTELLGRPARVNIGENFVIPRSEVQNSSTPANMLFAMLWMGIAIVPHLMLEEKKTKTLEALLLSPASAGQVVLGKALTGSFYVLLAGGLSLAFNSAYVAHWGLALLALSCSALFAVALALLMGTYIQSEQQFSLWSWIIMVGLLIPALFANEPLLTVGFRAIISWVPTAALAKLFQFSFSSGAPLDQILSNLAIALGGTALLFGLVVWLLRRSDR
jgi:ABC-2 type transport system permease protein